MTEPVAQPKQVLIRFLPTSNGWVRCEVCEARLKCRRPKLEAHARAHILNGDKR